MIVYEHAKAYPAYLIHYNAGNGGARAGGFNLFGGINMGRGYNMPPAVNPGWGGMKMLGARGVRGGRGGLFSNRIKK